MKCEPEHCCDPWINRLFGSAWRAFGLLFLVMLLILAIYLGIHTARTKPKVPWETAVQMGDDGRFQFRFQVAVLERFFSEQELKRLTNILGDRCEQARRESLAKRRALLGEIQQLRQTQLVQGRLPSRQEIRSRSGADPAANADALRLATGSQLVALPPGLPALFARPPAEWGDTEVLEITLTNVIETLQAELGGASAEARSQGAMLVNRAQRVDSDEARLRGEITREIAALEPPLSFTWLYHEGSGWVFEVVVWTSLGVLCNALIAMITACRAGEYDPRKFSFVIPKLCLAPLISVIFVAVWAAGITKSSVTFLNLPWFMALSFFLGFTTESLYVRLRRFADAIVGGVTQPSDQLPAGAGRDAHAWRTPRVEPREMLKPTSLPQLREALQRVARGEMEHTLVTGMTKS